MSTSAGKGTNKSEFIREQLQRNPEITAKAVVEAWESSGNEGSLSETLYYNVKKALGLAGGGGGSRWATPRAQGRMKKTPKAVRRGRGRPRSTDAAPATTTTATRSSAQGRSFDELEAMIDDMIFQLKAHGGQPDVEEALRQARRLLGRAHQG